MWPGGLSFQSEAVEVRTVVENRPPSLSAGSCGNTRSNEWSAPVQLNTVDPPTAGVDSETIVTTTKPVRSDRNEWLANFSWLRTTSDESNRPVKYRMTERLPVTPAHGGFGLAACQPIQEQVLTC